MTLEDDDVPDEVVLVPELVGLASDEVTAPEALEAEEIPAPVDEDSVP